MADFEIINPLIGGILIGLAATGMLWTNGRVMGISGILGGLLRPNKSDSTWRMIFFIGLFCGALIIPLLGFTIMSTPFDRGLVSALVGGLLVGFGTTLGNGCTSGHGVCGTSRLSPRSIIATLVFMFLGILSVAVMEWLYE